MSPVAKEEDLVKGQAMDWVLRQEGGVLMPSEASEFEAWLSSSPRHRELYASMEAFWAATEQLGGHPRMVDKRQWALAGSHRGVFGRRAVAASVAAAVLGVSGLAIVAQMAGPRPLATQAFRTAVGQQATVTLPDGSVVTLNTDTRVRTVADGDRRLVYLDRGQAFFQVAKDKRHPFVVTAGGRTVTALGTAFDVRLDDGEFKVVLVEGRVRVESASASKAAATIVPGSAGAAPAATPPIATDLSAGSELIASTNSGWRVNRTNATRETSWLKGQLIFDDEALGDVVAELNRYSPRKMVFADSQLASRRISGVYTPGDVQAFSMALKDARVADVREQPDGAIHIIPLN